MQTKFKSLAFILVLMLPMLKAIMTVGAQETYLKVVNPLTGDEWFNFTSATKSFGDDFIINITVVDVTNLFCWQIKLTWDADLLDFVNVSLPSDHVFAGQPFAEAGPLVESGSVIYGVALSPSGEVFNGTGSCCQVALRIVKRPTVSCSLALASIGWDTFMCDKDGFDIAFTPVDAFYNYEFLKQAAYLQIVNPLTGDGWFNFTNREMHLGDTFKVNITVVNVTDLAGWEITLRWNPSLLTFVQVEDPPDQVFARIGMNSWGVGDYRYADRGFLTCGRVAVSESAPIWPPTLTFDGSGTLAQVVFQIAREVSESEHEIGCNLTFFDIGFGTLLIDHRIVDIPFNATEGSYNYRYVPRSVQVVWRPTRPWPYVPSATPRVNEPVLVEANVTSTDVTDVTLKFRRQGEQWYNVSMVLNATTGLWVQTIPGQSTNGTMEFFVEVSDKWGTLTSSTFTFKVKDLPPGDFNGDGVVDIRDITWCILNFQKRSQDP
jgi:hypothetical protein